MKRIIILSFAVLVAITSCTKKEELVVLEADTPEYALAKSIAEKVPYYDPDQNNVLISTKYFDVTPAEMIRILHQNYGKRAEQIATFSPERIRKIIDQNADQYAQRKVLLHAAESFNITVTEEEIDSIITERFINRGGEEKFLNWLKNNNIDMETIRKDTREALMVEKYNDEALRDLIVVTDKELEEKYNEDKTATVQHILIKTQGLDDSTKAVKYAEIKALLERARGGEDFGELANQYSEDPGSNTKGGLYEDFARGRMVKPFEDASFDTPIGEISDIVETSYGYHIIKVLDRKKDERPFGEIREGLRKQMEQKKHNTVYQENIEKLKNKARFKVIDY